MLVQISARTHTSKITLMLEKLRDQIDSIAINLNPRMQSKCGKFEIIVGRNPHPFDVSTAIAVRIENDMSSIPTVPRPDFVSV